MLAPSDSHPVLPYSRNGDREFRAGLDRDSDLGKSEPSIACAVCQLDRIAGAPRSTPVMAATSVAIASSATSARVDPVPIASVQSRVWSSEGEGVAAGVPAGIVDVQETTISTADAVTSAARRVMRSARNMPSGCTTTPNRDLSARSARANSRRKTDPYHASTSVNYPSGVLRKPPMTGTACGAFRPGRGQLDNRNDFTLDVRGPTKTRRYRLLPRLMVQQFASYDRSLAFRVCPACGT